MTNMTTIDGTSLLMNSTSANDHGSSFDIQMLDDELAFGRAWNFVEGVAIGITIGSLFFC